MPQVTTHELLGVNYQIEQSFFFSYAEAMQMNLDFAEAMLHARRNGLEQFTVGPVKDDSPLVPHHFAPALRFSGCTSSAALCADDMGMHQSGRSVAPKGMNGSPTTTPRI